MTALLEIKQRIKGFYGQYEIYFLPLLKFILSMVYFFWINENMGYMSQLNNIFIVLILSLICCILPAGAVVLAGFALMLGHCYGLGIEVAGFMLILILFLSILFLRFSSSSNIVLVYTPLAFAFNVPVLLPVGSGLLSGAVSALPAGCGVIIYYFIRFLRAQSQMLLNGELDIMQKLTLLVDGLIQNWEMWVILIAVVVTTLIVNLIRTRAFDYAWRIAIVAGGVIYVAIVLVGSFFMDVAVSIVPLIVYAVVAVLVGMVLEFFVFGGDYTRTERLEYEDDEYYYYVKAVPKASVSTSERSIKKINAEPAHEDRRMEDVVSYEEPLFRSGKKPASPSARRKSGSAPIAEKPKGDNVDFEKKLEESLKDL